MLLDTEYRSRGEGEWVVPRTRGLGAWKTVLINVLV